MPRRSPFLRYALLFAGMVMLAVAGGCDNTIAPFSDESAFSAYGYVEASRTRQVIRVKRLNDPLTPDSTRTLAVTVTLQNLTAGTSATLRDSVVAFGDIYTHNFWTNMPIHPDTCYRLTVTDPNGKTTQATTRTPAPIAADVTPNTGNCLTLFSLIFPGITDRRRIRASVGFRYAGGIFWIPQNTGSDNGVAHVTFQPEEMLAHEIPSVDKPRPPLMYEPRCWKLDTDTIYVAYTQLGAAWFGDAPAGQLDFDPTASRFIDGGLGFFGALRRDTVTVTVDTSEVILLR